MAVRLVHPSRQGNSQRRSWPVPVYPVPGQPDGGSPLRQPAADEAVAQSALAWAVHSDYDLLRPLLRGLRRFPDQGLPLYRRPPVLGAVHPARVDRNETPAGIRPLPLPRGSRLMRQIRTGSRLLPFSHQPPGRSPVGSRLAPHDPLQEERHLRLCADNRSLCACASRKSPPRRQANPRCRCWNS